MAVKPILASSLIAKEDIGLFQEKARKRLRCGIECAAVDDALNGGCVYGQDGIYNISGATGSQAAETVRFSLLLFFSIYDLQRWNMWLKTRRAVWFMMARVTPFTSRYTSSWRTFKTDCGQM